MPLLTVGAGRSLLHARRYIGPGDLATFTHWRGLRAYSAAYAASAGPCLNLLDQAGANPLTANVTAEGHLDTAAIAAWVTANSVTTIKITRSYDQVGAAHINRLTLSQMPVLSLTVVGGTKPGAVFVRASVQQLVNIDGATSLNQPYSMSGIGKRTGSFTSAQIIVGGGTLLYFNTADQAAIYAGTAFTAAAADSVFHTVNALFSGASSKLMVDGSDGTGNAGTAASGNDASWGVNANFASQELEGVVLEGGLAAGDIGDSVRTAIHAQQVAYWGM